MSLPRPYYDEDGITIYHGDCREILQQLPKVDLVLTDPPYGIHMAAGFGNGGRSFGGKHRTEAGGAFLLEHMRMTGTMLVLGKRLFR